MPKLEEPDFLEKSPEDDMTQPPPLFVRETKVNWHFWLILFVITELLVIMTLGIYFDYVGEAILIFVISAFIFGYFEIRRTDIWIKYKFTQYKEIRDELDAKNQSITVKQLNQEMRQFSLTDTKSTNEKVIRGELAPRLILTWQHVTIGAFLMCGIFGLVFYSFIAAQQPTSERTCYLVNTSQLDLTLTDSDGHQLGVLPPNQHLEIDYSTSKKWYIAAKGERFNQKISGEDFDQGYVDSQYLRLVCRGAEVNG